MVAGHNSLASVGSYRTKEESFLDSSLDRTRDAN